MLTALSIRDVVLIERLDLAFGIGLTVLTGETGAGKSILLDSLGLALGARADAGLVRAGAGQASVTASFAPPAGHPLTTLPNVTLTSHAAYMTREASQRLLAAALDIVAAQRLGPEAQA